MMLPAAPCCVREASGAADSERCRSPRTAHVDGGGANACGPLVVRRESRLRCTPAHDPRTGTSKRAPHPFWDIKAYINRQSSPFLLPLSFRIPGRLVAAHRTSYRQVWKTSPLSRRACSLLPQMCLHTSTILAWPRTN